MFVVVVAAVEVGNVGDEPELIFVRHPDNLIADVVLDAQVLHRNAEPTQPQRRIIWQTPL